MIEAMSCATPPVAFSLRSVPEVLDDGVSGFIVSSEEAAVKAVKDIPRLRRSKCRSIFEERFTDVRMVNDYLAGYDALLSEPATVSATKQRKKADWATFNRSPQISL